MEKKYIKSAARVLNTDCVNKRGLDVSKNILWVFVNQGAADLWAVKVGGQKKFYRSARFEPALPALDWPHFNIVYLVRVPILNCSSVLGGRDT